MPTDSQRVSSARRAWAADAWLSPVLGADGVLTPHQAEALRVAPNGWSTPRLDGLGVLEELRSQVRPVSPSSCSRHPRVTEEKTRDLGAHDCLRKPVQTRSLVARVRAVLKRVSS